MRCTYYFFSVALNLLVYSYLAQRLGMFFALCASTRLGPMLVRVLCGGGIAMAEGYDKEGYDTGGFDRMHIHRETSTPYDSNGYDEYGFDKHGNPQPGTEEPKKFSNLIVNLKIGLITGLACFLGHLLLKLLHN